MTKSETVHYKNQITKQKVFLIYVSIEYCPQNIDFRVLKVTQLASRVTSLAHRVREDNK